MLKKTKNNDNTIEEKMDYLGLDLTRIPEKLRKPKEIKYRVPKGYSEKQFRQYRYISVQELEILITPINSLESIENKYKSARPLKDYLDTTNEENISRNATFIKMLKKLKINDIEKIEKEQEVLNKEIPFKVKYENNYLWKVYYSEVTDRFFMLVSSEDSDLSTFFYVLKKKIEGEDCKVFVPITGINYSEKYLKKSEYEDVENYLWLFTKDWPLIYEVYNKKGESSIHIVGETEIYQKIKSIYKIKLTDKDAVEEFFKLLKALFILQTEAPDYFEFKTRITGNGSIDFYHGKNKIKYEVLPEFINEEYKKGEVLENQIMILTKEHEEKLEELKRKIALQEIEYQAKEKQITTYLECKKTFFGKFKYYFKYNKKSSKKIENIQEDLEEENLEELKVGESAEKVTKKRKKENYNLEEITKLYKKVEIEENTLRNILMDLNSLKLKSKNLMKKIENAAAYIKEIDQHKKSIFEFWRYSNKDEMATLPEGETEKITVGKKIVKTFDYENDFEKLGITMDKVQRNILKDDELNSLYITSTNVIEILNKIKTSECDMEEIADFLKSLKYEQSKEKEFLDGETFDIFGGMINDGTKINMINNKKHREVPRDKFNILEINKHTNRMTFKKKLEKVINNIEKSMEKIIVKEELNAYKFILDDRIDERQINIFNLNPEKEMADAIGKSESNERIYFYKIPIKEGNNALFYTNSVFYENKNKTLPEGQDISTKVLIDIDKIKIKLKRREVFKIASLKKDEKGTPRLKVNVVEVLEFK